MSTVRNWIAQGSSNNPKSIPGLELWYTSQNTILSGDLCINLLDLSGNARNSDAVTGTSKPLRVINQLDGKPTLRFDGIDDYVDSPPFALSQPLTYYLVAKKNDDVVTKVLLGSRDEVPNQIYYLYFGANSNPIPYNNYKMYAGTSGANTFITNNGDVSIFCGAMKIMYTYLYGSGNFLYPTQINVGVKNTTAGIALGKGAANLATCCNMDFYELLMYSGEHTRAQRAYIFNYLKQKYPSANWDNYPVGTNVIDTGDLVIMGDKSGAESLTNSALYNSAILSISPDTIMGVGDFGGSTSNMYDQLLSGLEGYRDAGKLYSCPGNHDDYNTAITEVRSLFYNWFNEGQNYCKFTHGNIDFFIYDEYLSEDETTFYEWEYEVPGRTEASFKESTQGQWLLAQLAASTATFKIVVLHQPPWSSVTAQGHGSIVGLQWDWAAYGVDLVLSGHTHMYERILKNTGSGNVTFISCGAAGDANLSLHDYSKIEGSIVMFDEYPFAPHPGGVVVKLKSTDNTLTIKTYVINSSGVISYIMDYWKLTK